MMVKLIGPGTGQQASGSLAGALTFSNSRGRAYLKAYKKPHQPRTEPQLAMRAAMSFLSEQWGLLSPPYQAAWQEPADPDDILPFNAYQRYNLTRFRDFKAPSIVYPATELGAACQWGGWSVTGHIRRLQVQLTTPDIRQQWAWYIYHVSGTGIQPLWSQLIGVLPSPSPGTYTFTWQQNVPGTYWITFHQGTTTGKRTSSASVWGSAVVAP